MSIKLIVTTTTAAAMLAVSPVYTSPADTDTPCTSSGYRTDASFINDKDPLIQSIYWRVREKIEDLENLPGIKDVPEVRKSVYVLKPGLMERWDKLVREGSLVAEETDKEGRPYTVLLQAIIEKVLPSELEKKQIKSLKGVIHTPMQATPFCTTGGAEITKALINPAVKHDPLRYATVISRPIIDREYLFEGGDLDIVYPEYNEKKRTPEQLKIYQDALETFSSNLKDHPLNCESIPEDLIGAYHIFENPEGKKFAFAMKATQANDVSDVNIFGLWFGEYKESTPVYVRISEVEKFIKEHNFPPSS